jgi:uncharacterized protein YfdQ (DUF2303 family)
MKFSFTVEIEVTPEQAERMVNELGLGSTSEQSIRAVLADDLSAGFEYTSTYHLGLAEMKLIK